MLGKLISKLQTRATVWWMKKWCKQTAALVNGKQIGALLREKRDRMLRKALITKVLRTQKWGVEKWRNAVRLMSQAKWIY